MTDKTRRLIDADRPKLRDPDRSHSKIVPSRRLHEYEFIRHVPIRLVVRPGHLHHETERVLVEEPGRFLIIEKFTEGDRNARIRLDKAPLSVNKILRRGTKHLLWLGVGFITAITFVSYFTSARDLTYELAHFGLGFWEMFWILFFTGATAGVKGFASGFGRRRLQPDGENATAASRENHGRQVVRRI